MLSVVQLSRHPCPAVGRILWVNLLLFLNEDKCYHGNLWRSNETRSHCAKGISLKSRDDSNHLFLNSLD